MFARFNLKTNRDFNETSPLIHSSLLNKMDYLAEYAAELDEWETIRFPKEAIRKDDSLDYYFIGQKIYSKMKKQINKSLDNYIGVNGIINGSELQADWFPSIEADIFLSHSHKDENLAIKFAGWLYYKFGLITFIDSCIWSYSDDLLKKIDEKYCKNKKRKIYYYDTRNISTSHVHMMLMNALMKMIDKSECVFFLNTDNSTIKTKEEIDKNIEKTYSPWIYSEINATNLIRRKPLCPKERNRGNVSYSLYKYVDDFFIMDHTVNLSEMYEINDDVLSSWEKSNIDSNGYLTKEVIGIRALDELYKLTLNK